MSFFTAIIGVLAPLMIALSPVLSYGDQAFAMHRSKSSAGFSLDIPLIMLIASFLRYVISRQACARRRAPLPELLPHHIAKALRTDSSFGV